MILEHTGLKATVWIPFPASNVDKGKHKLPSYLWSSVAYISNKQIYVPKN